LKQRQLSISPGAWISSNIQNSVCSPDRPNSGKLTKDPIEQPVLYTIHFQANRSPVKADANRSKEAEAAQTDSSGNGCVRAYAADSEEVNNIVQAATAAVMDSIWRGKQ
jgi:hypothetical protein